MARGQRPAPRPRQTDAVAHAYGALGLGKLANALEGTTRQPHLLHRPRRREPLRAAVSDLRHGVAGLQPRYGGTSTYGSFDPARPMERAYKVSYNRPYTTRDYRAVNMVFNAEYPMVRWLEANGYDVSYFTGLDSDRRGALIRNHKMFCRSGTMSIWSGGAARNVEAARDAGVHLAFFSGNDVFWKIRWEPSTDPSHTPYRTMVTYKETHANAKIDPMPDVWTGTWRDSRPFNPEGPKPENALKGTIFTVNAWRNDPLIVPARIREAAVLAQHRRREAQAGREGGARLRHSRARMERGSRQRIPSGRVGPDVGDDGQQRALHPGLRHRLRVRHGHASSDALPRAERRARCSAPGTVQWAVGARPEPRYRDRRATGAAPGEATSGSAWTRKARFARFSRRPSICSPTWA